MFYPRSILQDMPFHIKRKIVDFSDLETRISLRNSSKDLRRFVDNAPIFYEKVRLETNRKTERLQFDVSTGNSELQLTYLDGLSEEENLDRFLDFLSVIIKNPKAEFLELSVNIKSIYLSKFKAVLNTLPYQLSVRNLCLGLDLSQDDLLDILPCFQAENLKYISFALKDGILMDKVTELDQWKRPSSAFITASVPIEQCFHFKELEMYNLEVLSLENLQKVIANALKHGESFEGWEIVVNEMDPAIMEHFGNKTFFDIPNSDRQLKWISLDGVFHLKIVS